MGADQSRGHLLVLGGGVAGISAALEGASRGFEVTLVERKRWLGGKAYAFLDRASGLEVDNGQHVIIGAYKNFRRLLRGVGSEHLVDFQPDLCIPYRELKAGGGLEETTLSGLPLPAPLHLGGAISAWGALTWREKLSLVGPALEMLWVGDGVSRQKVREARGVSLGAWLAARGCNQRVKEAFWEPLALATLNGHVDEVSFLGLAKVLSAGFAGSRKGAVMGVPRCNLSDLVGRPSLAALQRAGVEVLLDATVTSLTPTQGRGWTATLGDGRSLGADQVIAAVEPDLLGRWLPPSVLEGAASLTRAQQVVYSPIVSAHLLYEQPLRLRHRFMALLGSRLQWAFDSRDHHKDFNGGHVSLVISGADAEASLDKGPLEAWIWGEARKLLPELLGQKGRMVIIKEKRATLRVTPDTDALRPAMGKMVDDGLYVAGAWTQTGFPSTLEGAAMSGLAAVEGALARHGERVQIAEPLTDRDLFLRALEAAGATLARLQDRLKLGRA